jgi:ABC-type multidrug transport system permease subunit
MTPEQVSRTLTRFPWFFLGGVVVFVCGFFTDSYITMTGLIAVMLGACIGGVGRGLSVRGMWFLAVVFWIPTVFVYAVLTYLHIWHLMEHPGELGRFVSLAVATWLLGIQSRLLLTVTTVNWRVSHR